MNKRASLKELFKAYKFTLGTAFLACLCIGCTLVALANSDAVGFIICAGFAIVNIFLTVFTYGIETMKLAGKSK